MPQIVEEEEDKDTDQGRRKKDGLGKPHCKCHRLWKKKTGRLAQIVDEEDRSSKPHRKCHRLRKKSREEEENEKEEGGGVGPTGFLGIWFVTERLFL